MESKILNYLKIEYASTQNQVSITQHSATNF